MTGKICVFHVHKPFSVAGWMVLQPKKPLNIIAMHVPESYLLFIPCVKHNFTTEWQRKDEWALGVGCEGAVVAQVRQ